MVKLLVVDDDIVTCDFLRVFFEKKGYQVWTASDGTKALSIVKSRHPDIILLDIKMSGISGIEVLQKIKELDKKAKVIMMTCVNEEAMVELAKQYGAVDYLVKPFSLDQLENNILPNIIKQLV